MPKLGFINTTQPARLSAQIEPIRNVLNSLLLIADCNEYPGINPFITRTHSAISDAVRKTNEILMIGLQYAALPEKDFSNFQDYLDDLKKIDPSKFQERVFHSYDTISAYKVGIISKDNPVTVTKKDQDRLLSSKAIYLEYVERCFGNETLDYDIEGRAYDYLVNPKELRECMVRHLQFMWDHFLKEEFAKNQAILEKTISEFNIINFASLTPFELAKKITGHDIEQEWANNRWELDWIEKSKRVVFTPSFHMGPYLGRRVREDVMYIFFSPKIRDGLELSSPDLTRTDISMRLITLSDDVRLKILKMLAHQTELSSKQIMDDLQLTQSCASRHLKQLSATGFLDERRQNSAKIYSLNPSFVSQTLDAVSNYLLKK